MTRPEQELIENGVHQPQRDQTDQSLRVERAKADAIVEKLDAFEGEADSLVRIAREGADEAVQTAREAADRELHPGGAPSEASTDRERVLANAVLEHDRSTADAALAVERADRRRYLIDLVAFERETTDKDLFGERIQADSVIAARDEFLATVSHDLRSMLNSLALSNDLLLARAPEGVVGDDMRKHAAISGRSVARMNRLINDLLDISSIDAGKLSLFPEVTEIADILRETLDVFEPIAAAKSIALQADGARQHVQARFDSGRVLQVLANLVGNAIKFTPREGQVSIGVESDETEIHFSVRDTGIGIPDDAREVVFERFCQLKNDRRGLGLGLYISKCIVEAHGGRMWVESELCVGSTFHFTLPSTQV